MNNTEHPITEHVNEEKGLQLLEDFYNSRHGKGFLMLELVAFIYEQGYQDAKAKYKIQDLAKVI
ncbi:MAG: hypothetical protein WC454_10055 [Phycisphaerae bacterium]|jgi:hypothetical protein